MAPAIRSASGVLASRRSFLRGTLAGGAGGVLAMTGVHAISHASPAHAVAVQASEHGPTHVDIGFCTDMAAHHVQALDMCERVLGRDTGGAVQSAATEVLRNQSIEVGMMRAWLTDWGASTAPPVTVMAWMDHGSMSGVDDHMEMDMADDAWADDAIDHAAAHDQDMASDTTGEHEMAGAGMPLADMPGYATPEELSALAMAEGLEKGRMWLELMRAHHVGGVMMAEAAVALASQEKVIRLARTQAEVQAYEISQYDLLLATYP